MFYEINLTVFEHELYSLMDLKFALKENTSFAIQARFKIWNNLDFQNIQSNHKTLFKFEFISHEMFKIMAKITLLRIKIHLPLRFLLSTCSIQYFIPTNIFCQEFFFIMCFEPEILTWIVWTKNSFRCRVHRFRLKTGLRNVEQLGTI